MHNPAPISLDIPGVTVRRATLHDLDRVLEVVHDATRRMQEKGFNHWRLYLTDAGLEQVRRRLKGANGEEAYLISRTSDDQPLGAFAIEWSDREMWGDERGGDGRAGYVHMLSVHRLARRTGLGERMIRFADRVVAARGRELFRLDCWRRSDFLRDYYTRLGFELIAETDSSLLWQKRVSRG